MNFPEELRYTKEHVWVKVEENEAIVGITEYAQSELGEIVFVELPVVDMTVEADASFAVVESTKTASDVYVPVAGKVLAVNEALNDTPSLVNDEPYAGGWIAKLVDFDPSAVEGLMSAADYKNMVE